MKGKVNGLRKNLFYTLLRQSLGKNIVYYGILLIAASTAFSFAMGLPPQVKIALIIECFIPLFSALIVTDTGLLDRYVGSWEIVLSSVSNPSLFLQLRFGAIGSVILLFLLVINSISVIFGFSPSPFGLALSSILNTLSLGMLGITLALVFKTSLIPYIVILGLSAIHIQLAPLIPPTWQLFPHVFGRHFSTGFPLRLFQLLVIAILPFLISWRLRHDQ